MSKRVAPVPQCSAWGRKSAAKNGPESPRSKRDRELLQKIKQVCAQSTGAYGSPGIKLELADEGCRVTRTSYRTREEARADIFDCIEVVYNRKRRYGYLVNFSPVDFEQQSVGLHNRQTSHQEIACQNMS